MKFTKTNEKQLREFMGKMDGNGCVTVDQWTSGSGRHTSNRALPLFVTRFERKDYAPTNRPKHGTPERVAFDFLNANPKRKAVLVLDREAMLDFLFGSAHLREL